jgi:hypothetical protein
VRRKGATLPINSVVAFVIAIIVGVVVLAIVIPLLQSQQGASACLGPYKGVAAVLADMTGVNIC